MSRKIKTFKAIAMLVCLLLLVSACGTAATTTAATTTAPSTAATTTAATTSATTAATSATTSAATEPAGAETVRIAALKGPTGIGMVKLMEDAAAQKTTDKYTFSLAAAPDDLVAKLSSGEVDIAALPTNLAATLYQKTNGRIKMLAINTLGVLYVLENGDTVKSVADLKGKKIAATGQGATPEYAINVVLKDAGIDPAGAVTYMAEHAELATLAISGKEKLIMLPEPFVTTVLSKVPQFRIAINLTEAFGSALSKVAGSEKAELAQGCIAVRAEFAEKNPEAIKKFLSAYEASTKWVNENVAEAGELTVKHNIMADAKLAAKAIPNCNIVYIDGADMKPVLEPLLKILFEAKPQSVGGKLPDDSFYYQVG